MAAVDRPKEATYEVDETIKVDTQDNEDHTFNGIVFPLKCENILPIDHIVIRSIAVRGELGPLTVWVSKNNMTYGSNSFTFCLTRQNWDKVYEKVHNPSKQVYQNLELDSPIVMKPGEVKGIYVHSALTNDYGIVYDESSNYYSSSSSSTSNGWSKHNNNSNEGGCRYEDGRISIHTGLAHLSNIPFVHIDIWGSAWRCNREFVGQLEYGAVYQLWGPEAEVRTRFGPRFAKAVQTLLLCQRREESPVSMLPDECLFYILNMCRWDWFGDTQESMQQYHQECKKPLF